jgi:hypothetical protein
MDEKIIGNNPAALPPYQNEITLVAQCFDNLGYYLEEKKNVYVPDPTDPMEPHTLLDLDIVGELHKNTYCLLLYVSTDMKISSESMVCLVLTSNLIIRSFSWRNIKRKHLGKNCIARHGPRNQVKWR